MTEEAENAQSAHTSPARTEAAWLVPACVLGTVLCLIVSVTLVAISHAVSSSDAQAALFLSALGVGALGAAILGFATYYYVHPWRSAGIWAVLCGVAAAVALLAGLSVLSTWIDSAGAAAPGR